MRVTVAVFAVAFAVTMSSCVTSGRMARLEQRLAEQERAAAQRDLETQAALIRVEANLAALAAGLARIAVDEDGRRELTRQLDSLARRLDRLEAGGALGTGAAPPPRGRTEPDPALVYAVGVAGAPVKGKDTALVTIVRAGEYACPFCEKVRGTLDQIANDYGDQVRFVYRHYVVHPQRATIPARAACAAHHQGRFLDMDALLWDRAYKTRQFDQAHIETLAGELGLDLDRFRADLSGACVAEVQADMKELSRLGVGGTPAFFINGRYLAGARPIGDFKTLIDEELTKAKARVKKGTKPRKYYQQWVLKKGLTKLTP